MKTLMTVAAITTRWLALLLTAFLACLGAYVSVGMATDNVVAQGLCGGIVVCLVVIAMLDVHGWRLGVVKS